MTEPHTTQQEEQQGPALSCLNGIPAPDFLQGDLETLMTFPEEAQKAFWDVLGPCLAEQKAEKIDEAVDRFARRFDLRGSEVAHAVRGSRFLVQNAARRNAEKHAIAADCATLVEAHAEALREIILEKYEDARKVVRVDVVRSSILNHGKLMTGVDWRMDRMSSSQHGVIDEPVALLTFNYLEGNERSRVTLHAELPALVQLRRVLDELLAPK